MFYNIIVNHTNRIEEKTYNFLPYRLCQCRRCKSLSDPLISGSHSHQASKMSLSMSLVTLPNPRASFLPPPYLSAAWPLYAPNTVFLDLLNLLIAPSPLPLPPLYWLFSTWLQDDSFLGLHPKSSASSTHFCEQPVHRDDFR